MSGPEETSWCYSSNGTNSSNSSYNQGESLALHMPSSRVVTMQQHEMILDTANNTQISRGRIRRVALNDEQCNPYHYYYYYYHYHYIYHYYV